MGASEAGRTGVVILRMHTEVEGAPVVVYVRLVADLAAEPEPVAEEQVYPDVEAALAGLGAWLREWARRSAGA